MKNMTNQITESEKWGREGSSFSFAALFCGNQSVFLPMTAICAACWRRRIPPCRKTTMTRVCRSVSEKWGREGSSFSFAALFYGDQSAFLPMTALMRRTPAEEDSSFRILKLTRSPVLEA